MAPAVLLSAVGTAQAICRRSDSAKQWQPKRLVSSGLVQTRSSSSANMGDASAMSSISLRSVDFIFGSRRRLGLRPNGRSYLARRAFTAAVEGSIAVEEASTASVEVGEAGNTGESVPVAGEGTPPAAPPQVKAERFKPRVPGQKARREDPTVPAEALIPGAVFTGTVSTIQSFGAFVNFGAFTDGLVHISKLSSGYVSNVGDVVTLGQEVKVTILNVEESSGRIALSMVEKEEKEASGQGEVRQGGDKPRFQPGPDGRPVNRGRIAGGGRQTKRDEPKKPPTKFVKGQEVEGTVKNKIRSGVFVNLPEDEEGFLRFNDVPGAENMAPESSLQTGQKIKATVLKIERGKVILTMKPIVDISSVNRDINKGQVNGATNPFEIAFRAFNLIPEVPKESEELTGEPVIAGEGAISDSTAPVEESPAVEEESVPEVTARAEETPVTDEDDVPEVATAIQDASAVEEDVPEVAAALQDAPALQEDAPEVAAALQEAPVVGEDVPEVAAALQDVPALQEDVPEVAAALQEAPVVEEDASEVAAEVDKIPVPIEDGYSEATPASEISVLEEVRVPETTVPKNAEEDKIPVPVDDGYSEATTASETSVLEVVGAPKGTVAGADVPEMTIAVDAPIAEEEVVPETTAEVAAPVEEQEVIPETAAAVDEVPVAEEEVVLDAIPEASPAGEKAPVEEEIIPEATAAIEEAAVEEEVVPEAATAVEEVPAAKDMISDAVADSIVEAPATEEVIPESTAAMPVKDASVEKKSDKVSAALVKELREETGAGMMDCKRALADSGGDIEKARETLRKKGLASADKKASRIASEGLVGSYIHDSRIGVLVEVNCETDFVSRGQAFKSLVEDVGMQVVASQQVQYVSVDDIPADFVNKEKEVEAQRDDLTSRPEAIRGKIVEGRVSKRLNEIALLEQPYIRDDKILVKDFVKQTVATLGENIKVRRFERYILGEGLQKKSTDFAAEVAAQAATKAPSETPKAEEIPAPALEAPNVVVSAGLVKELRAQTGAGMMDCKKALAASENDLEKAVAFLRKKGLASADKKASRLASDGLIGSYIHDGRIGILIEVNCETDFVARGDKFKELVDDLAMQVAAYPLVQVVSVDDVPAEVVAKEKEMESGKEDLANKPEAIRSRIVDGRVAKRLSELALLEQPFIRDDKRLVRDIVKETVASLGENIQVRRFTRFNLGEGIQKKVVDFAAEVAAQTKV